jgi:hypothetical protein
MHNGLVRHLKDFGHRAGIIVNDTPAFVYLKVTKAAGTSILRHTLEKHPEHIAPFHIGDHCEKMNGWLSTITDEALAGYYFFTVVRNPWDRFVSLATYVRVLVEELARDFDKHMKNPNIRHHAHEQECPKQRKINELRAVSKCLWWVAYLYADGPNNLGDQPFCQRSSKT